MSFNPYKTDCFYCGYSKFNCYCEDDLARVKLPPKPPVPLFPDADDYFPEPEYEEELEETSDEIDDDDNDDSGMGDVALTTDPDNSEVSDETTSTEETPPKELKDFMSEYNYTFICAQQSFMEAVKDDTDYSQNSTDSDKHTVRRCLNVAPNVKKRFTGPTGLAPPMPRLGAPSNTGTPFVQTTFHTPVGNGIPSGQAQVQTITAANTNHGPTSFNTPEQLALSTWDGIPFNPCGKTNQEIHDFVFPQGRYTMRGLEDVYNENPFNDPANPTIHEIEAWNIRVIQHFRDLLGYDHPVLNDHNMFMRAQWGQERKHSTYWNVKYPGTVDSAYGPCIGGTNAHCGATFLPNSTDQIPYKPNPTYPTVGLQSGSEGIFGINLNVPWYSRFSKIIGDILFAEGLNGHMGPFLRREKIGYAHYINGSTVSNRIKWSGALLPDPCL